ncbi:Mercuric reductase [Phycisphaerae bacterium RAS2]|nr:Mercuric reductase [Phycisphaerae bacterium RAS2]
MQTTIERRLICPRCGKKGKRVSALTLHSLLKDEHRDAVADAQCACSESEGGCKPVTQDTGWRFCESAECDVVYFAEETGTTFTKSQLKVAVGVKERVGDRPLCYCFGHSVASIKQELATTGRSDALEDIRRKMEDPGCTCEITNPSGACCLGSVAKGIKTATQELGITEPQARLPRPSPSSGSSSEKVAKIGTLVSAIVASSCCWLPLVLLAVGVSGAGVASTLEAYRPAFIVITFAFLGAAFYFTYRPSHAGGPVSRVDGGDGDDCCAGQPREFEGCCAPGGKRRFGVMALNKVMLWVVTVLVVAFLFFPKYVGLLMGTGNGSAVTAKMQRAMIRVEGMTCEGCAGHVEKAIRSVPGVLAVQVDFPRGQAVVGIEARGSVPREEILAALEKAGYGGAFVEPTK